MQPDAIFPASWFVLSYIALLIIIVAVAAYWARTHGQLDDTEEIKWKVFDDGIPNPQSEPTDQSKRAAR